MLLLQLYHILRYLLATSAPNVKGLQNAIRLTLYSTIGILLACRFLKVSVQFCKLIAAAIGS